MASVHIHNRSPYWQANFLQWSEARSDFTRCARSTGVPTSAPKEDAQRVADEFERIGKSLCPDNAKRGDRRFYIEALNGLCRVAGVEEQRLDTTWKEYSARWIAEKKADVGHTSFLKYQGHVNKLTEHLGHQADLPISAINHETLQEHYDKLIDSGLAPSTATYALKTLSSIFGRAVLLGYCDTNQVRLVKKRKKNDGHFERMPFSVPEVGTIFAYLRDNDLKEWETACMFGLHFGLRLVDSCSRRFSELAMLDNGQLVIQFKPSKKAQKITLPIVKDLAIRLRALEALNEGDAATPKLGKVKREGQLSHEFNAILDAAGIDVPIAKARGDAGNDMRMKSFHSWRHTNKSLLINAGVPARVADLINAHDDPRVAAGYTHIEVSTMAEAIESAIK